MTDLTPEGSRIPGGLPGSRRVSFFRLVWLIVLAPILAVSAYSLFWVARLGCCRPYIAIAVYTCFDGVALLSADYSLRIMRQLGHVPAASVLDGCVGVRSPSPPSLLTLSAWLGNEPYGAWILARTPPERSWFSSSTYGLSGVSRSLVPATSIRLRCRSGELLGGCCFRYRRLTTSAT